MKNKNPEKNKIIRLIADIVDPYFAASYYLARKKYYIEKKFEIKERLVQYTDLSLF